MQKGMNNGGRKNARYHAADDRLGEAERQLRHKDARAPIFDEDAGYHRTKQKGRRQPSPCQQGSEQNRKSNQNSPASEDGQCE
jgi:hypothetical protein